MAVVDMLTAPFPYFGGKAAIAPLVWRALGDVDVYIEPFCGSCAVLLARPDEHRWWEKLETVNDADGLLANFWRAVANDPEAVAHYADWPVNEVDLHARHIWLVQRKYEIAERLMADPEWYDAKAAGWWVWGIGQWIGGGWCSGRGPWTSDGQRLVKTGGGVERNRPHLSCSGMGVHAPGIVGVKRELPHLSHGGMGVHALRILETEVTPGTVAAAWRAGIQATMARLHNRLRRVRVTCGDWQRIVGSTSATTRNGLTGVFLDPPYGAAAGRDPEIYAADDLRIASDVRAWCLQHGHDPLFRIVLAGYESEHDELERAGWRVHAWTAHGGYAHTGNGRGKTNRFRERLWLSPHCLPDDTPGPRSLFDILSKEEI